MNSHYKGKDDRNIEDGRYEDQDSGQYSGMDKRDYDDRGGGRGRSKMFFRKKVCRYCTSKLVMDYKNADALRKFTTERGKILPRRITGTCAKHQRKLSIMIKRARILALLPFVSSK